MLALRIKSNTLTAFFMGETKVKLKISWVNALFLTLTPVVGIAGAVLLWNEYGAPGMFEGVIFISMYLTCGLSITAGYHRLFAHRAYEGHWLAVLFYTVFAAGAFQNSVIEWCSDHRNHHKMVDTDNDPYNAKRGFWYSHMVWIMIVEDRHANDFANVKDLQDNKIIAWQHRNIFKIGVASGWLFPMAIGYAVGGIPYALSGFIWGGVIRTVAVHHGTFCVNSIAHIFGTQPYDDTNTSRDSWWVAFLTFGEGYHNFHHIFQADYRNGIRWYHFDPTKWLIKIFSSVGLATKLKQTPQHSIDIAILDMKIIKSTRKLSDRSIDSELYVGKMKSTRDDLRSAMYNLYKVRNEKKTGSTTSSEELSAKIVQLKRNIAAGQEEISAIFADINNAKPISA